MRICILFFLVLMTGCSEEKTPEQKAETTIKNHFTSTGAGNAYQPLQTKLDSFYAVYSLTGEGAKLMNEYNSVHAENKDIYSPNALFLANREMALRDTINARTQRFGKKFYGWKAIHAYRSKNPQGVLTEATDTFLLNREYQLMQADTIAL